MVTNSASERCPPTSVANKLYREFYGCGPTVTVKSALSRERRHLRQIDELKIKKNWRKHAGRSILSYKLDLKAANLEQTHTQSKYCNPRAHARRALIMYANRTIDQTIEPVAQGSG